MKALYCDRCGQYYHEKMTGYINQANISILDAETCGPEEKMDLCDECKKIVYECIHHAERTKSTQKKKPSPNMILAEYSKGESLDSIAEKYGITRDEAKKAVDKFR